MTRNSPAADWETASEYRALLRCDRRAFAWEWLRRTTRYRRLWRARRRLAADTPKCLGLVEWIDPNLAAPDARPIWTPTTDPKVLRTRAAAGSTDLVCRFDLRNLANHVSVAIDDSHAEHWLLSDGEWAVRLTHSHGTLIGGGVLLGYEIEGLSSAALKLSVLQQLLALSERGEMPARLHPREVRAARWILELRTADALAAKATQHDMARIFYGTAVERDRWRINSASYRLRVQRLVKTARRYLADPLSGPWFE